MEFLQDLIDGEQINKFIAWFTAVFAFVSGAFMEFRGYSRTKKIWIVAGFILALVLVLTALQAMFG